MKRYTNLLLNILILTLLFIILKKALFKTNQSAESHLKNKTNINLFETKLYRAKYDINCNLLLKNNTNEIQKAKKLLSSLKKSHNSTIDLLPDSNFIFSRDKCAEFKKIRRYNRFDKYTSKIELEFPLAFSILTYENVEQFERLLNTIYRSHNIYCVHIDLKSSQVFKNAIKSITDCFDNVFITTKLEYIIYAGFSRLQADLNCLNDLLNMNELLDSGLSPNLFNKKNVYWKYLLNLASSEFPIKTNYQIVKILKILKGSNSIYIDKTYKQLKYRTEHIWFNDYLNNKLYAVKKVIHNRPPHDIQLVKGSAYGVFERGFLENIYLNEKIMDFIEWLKTTFSPDEL